MSLLGSLGLIWIGSLLGIVNPFACLPEALRMSSAGIVYPLDSLLCDSVFVRSNLDANIGQERRSSDGILNLSNFSFLRIAE